MQADNLLSIGTHSVHSTHVDIFLEALARVSAEPVRHVSTFQAGLSPYVRWQDGAFCTTLWKILVLESLRARECIVLVEQSTLVHLIVP
jgi:hypothetical protein